MPGSFNIIATIILLSSLPGCGTDTDGRKDIASDSPSSAIVTLAEGNIDSFLVAGGPTIVEFGGKRCLPCMEMRKTLGQLGTYRPDVRIGAVYWEDNPELFEKWKIELVPAQIVFDKDGREATRHKGTWALDEMRAALSRHLR
jgi:thioredoxin 1